MKDLIEALTIFMKYVGEDKYSPTHCEHDVLYVGGRTLHPLNMVPADVERLNALSFHFDADDLECWYSYRFGSA